jgi:hypothetical protein
MYPLFLCLILLFIVEFRVEAGRNGLAGRPALVFQETSSRTPMSLHEEWGFWCAEKNCDKWDQSLKTAPVLAEVTSFAYRAR